MALNPVTRTSLSGDPKKMRNSMRRSLAGIDASLARLGRDRTVKLMQPGVAAHEVRRKLAEVGLPVMAELEDWLGWHNGTAPGAKIGDLYLLPGFYPLSLDDITTSYRTFVEDSRWDENWVPFLADGGGDFYVLDLGGSKSNAIRHFWLEEGECHLEFCSLSDFAETLAISFANGAIFVGDDDMLHLDYEAFAATAARIGPRVPWWR